MCDEAPQVLIVDDDDDVREALRLLLEDEGFRVVTAPHGASALQQLESGTRPCAIVLDLMMPVMSGWDFWDAHQLSPHHDIPVVVLTATGLGPGCLGKETPVLRKPVGRDQFLETVGSLCA